MENNKIGKFIADARKNKCLTQKELGDKLFVSDKAVSKWERGLSLPDISLLKSLSEILDVTIDDILSGEFNSGVKIDNLEEKIKEIQININKHNKRKYGKIIILLLLIIILFITKNIKLNMKEYKVYYGVVDSKVNMVFPRLSFFIKNKDQSFSMINYRNSNVIKNEIRDYLKSLKYLVCNDTVYYYDNKRNVSIIEYGVKDYILFSKVTFNISRNDYCLNKKIMEYNEYIDLMSVHGMNEGPDYKNGSISVYLLDGHGYPYDFSARFQVYLNNDDSRKLLEESYGSYEIKNGKFIYVRDKIIVNNLMKDIPMVSIFTIDNRKLILDDNYLSQYVKKIVLD